MIQRAPRRTYRARRATPRRRWPSHLKGDWVLRKGMGLYLRNVVPFSIVTLLVFGVLIAVDLTWIAAVGAEAEGAEWLMLLHLTLKPVLPFFVAGILAPGVFRQLCGRRASIRDGIRVGLRALLPTLGVASILAAMVGVVLAVVGSIILSYLDSYFWSMEWGGVLVCLALAVLGFVGIVTLISRFYVAVPAAAVEGVGPIRALSRSLKLTRGSRWSVIGVVGSLFLLEQVALFVLRKILPRDSAISPSDLLHAIPIVLLFGAWKATCSASAYYELRRAQEGVAPDDLAAIFE